MKTYYLKIRDKFISSVQQCIKKHEYRLASPERMQIKVGDTLVLISNQDKKKFIRTTVKKVKVYSNWKEALEENWKQDFHNIFPSLDAALKECYKFYPKEEVDIYGIVSFEITPLIVDYCKASVLLDTNIIIKRESGNNVSFEVSKLFNWFDRKSVKKYIHQISLQELSTYGNEKAKEVILTKMGSYETLPKFAIETDDYFESVVSQYAQDQNGLNDNALLREVYNGNIEILLTDDSLMLRKAQELYIRDLVVTSAELLSYFETEYPQNLEYKMLAVKLKEFADVKLNDPFFDSLREDYEGKKFDDWFKRKGKEKAYVFEDSDGLKGFLYLKVEDESENYSDIDPILAPKKRLKVGTFKIDSTGFRLGERFLKIIFDNARNCKAEEIYVTLFEDKRDNVRALKCLMEQWGFQKHGYKKSNGELVLVKTMTQYIVDKDPKFNFPIIQDNSRPFFLPIYPQYHTDLFPDMILKNEDMHLYEENLAHRYAIEKIYLSGAFNVKAKPGDVVLIYRVGDRYPKKYSSVVTGIAIIEEIHKTKSVNECIEICKYRSIFSETAIRKLYDKYPTVIKLLDYIPFKTKVTLDKLQRYNIIAQATGPRPFETLSKENFETIYKLGMEE